jgi:hypothetical protein
VAKKKRSKPRPPVRPASATPAFGVYEVEREPGPDSRVIRGNLLTDAEAVARLRDGLDVAVCGPDGDASHDKARELAQAAWGAVVHHDAHDTSGRWRSLRHFHPAPYADDTPHTFYEEPPRRTTSRRRA